MAESLTSKAPSKKAGAKKTTGSKPTGSAKTQANKRSQQRKENGTAQTRRKLGDQGWLQQAILSVCEDFAAGKIDLDGKPLTPHRMVPLIEERTGNKPSSGAVAACLDRWSENGFAKINDKPKSFKDFTAAGKKEGLEAMVEKHRRKTLAASKAS